MEKISVSDGRSLLKTAAATIRAQDQEIRELREKLAERLREDRIVKIAKELEDKNLHGDLDFSEKVAMLKQKNLDTVEEAVKMAAPQGRGLGVLSEDLGGGGGAYDTFVNFINTGETPD